MHVTEQLANFLGSPLDRPLTWLYVCRCIENYIVEKRLIQGNLAVVSDGNLATLLGIPLGTRVSKLTIHMLLHRHMSDPSRSQGYIQTLEDDIASRARRVLSNCRLMSAEIEADPESRGSE